MQRASSGIVNKCLDDKFCRSFSVHIINYEPSRGFVVPKFTMYDGMID